MKKISLLLFISVIIISVSNGQFTKIGGGLVYGTGFHFNNVTAGYEADLHRGPVAGIFLTGIYELNLPFHIAPSLTFFFPRTNNVTIGSFPQSTRVSATMIDLNGHYVFNSLDKFEFYGLAGLNITFAKLKWLDSNQTGTDNALGLNVGAGTYMKMTEQLDLYGEIKYILSRYDQLLVNVGVLINLDWLKKNENPGI
jgi:opacity protein-like surface antigen